LGETKGCGGGKDVSEKCVSEKGGFPYKCLILDDSLNQLISITYISLSIYFYE
jgi:hypothetical protein